MSVKEVHKGRDAVESWLRGIFPDAQVEVIDDTMAGTHLFRVRTDSGGWHEIEFPDEALEDYRESIIDDLEQQDVSSLLRDHPQMRFTYLHLERRVPPVERLRISYGDVHYLVTRQLDGLVSILRDGERLSGMPPRTIMTDSIHRPPLEEWHQDIEKWEGKGER